ncbi:unnamed protein product, partial [Prunus brigantina]
PNPHLSLPCAHPQLHHFLFLPSPIHTLFFYSSSHAISSNFISSSTLNPKSNLINFRGGRDTKRYSGLGPANRGLGLGLGTVA